MTRRQPVVLLLSLALMSGCSRAESTAAASGQTASPVAAPAKKPKGTKIERIVFLDLERCCDCTRKRIDASWKTLMEVLGFPPTIPLDRFHMDTQADKAAPYRAKRAVMVPPAIYFFGPKESLVEVLQGEVKADQIRKVLE